ncbi:MAG: 50S ribosomal protein L18 [Candidatus Kryptoniota bacterium]
MGRLEKKREKRERIKRGIKAKIRGTPERPRLVVFRSLKHIYGAIVDDTAGRTLVQVSSLSKDIASEVKLVKGKVSVGKIVGVALARKALERNIQTVVFDRNGYRYHGRLKALAEGAREGGLKF